MSVGKRLKKARKAKGLSIDDIKNKSKIKKSYLEALENDNYKKLPGEVYTKVYIRGYAKIVDLDPQELLSEYENEKKQGKKKETEVKEKEESKAKNFLDKDSILKVILGIILILILVLLSYNIFFRTDQNQNNTASNTQQTQIAQQDNSNNSETNSNNSSADSQINQTTESETSQANNENNTNNTADNDSDENQSNDQSNNDNQPGDDNNTNADNKQTNNNGTSSDQTKNDEKNNENNQEQTPLIQEETKELTIIAEEKSWLQVTVDGELKFQGFINEDETMTHNGSENIRLKIGNGIAVRVEYEGEVQGPFGKRGEVIIKEFDLKN